VLIVVVSINCTVFAIARLVKSRWLLNAIKEGGNDE
jgi:hypothetical protein